jgi:hypothetical protein
MILERSSSEQCRCFKGGISNGGSKCTSLSRSYECSIQRFSIDGKRRRYLRALKVDGIRSIRFRVELRKAGAITAISSNLVMLNAGRSEIGGIRWLMTIVRYKSGSTLDEHREMSNFNS